jgi:hypothetical protein
MCFGILIGGVGSSKVQRIRPSQPQSLTRNDIKTINKTTTLEVAIETTDNNLLIVRLKNISSKDLNGYVVGITNQVTITTDLSAGDRIISPGQTHDMEIPLGSSPMEITILAAMFTDGSMEGEPASVAELRPWRLGLKEELTRSLSVLDAMLQMPHSPTALDSLTSRLSPSDDSELIRAGRASGARSARNSLNTEIELLRERLQRDRTLTQKEGLLELKRRIERRIASL